MKKYLSFSIFLTLKTCWIIGILLMLVIKVNPKAIALVMDNNFNVSKSKLNIDKSQRKPAKLIEEMKKNQVVNFRLSQNLISEDQKNSDTSLTSSDANSVDVALEDFRTFPVALNVGRRNVQEAVLVRGSEDGSKAINFQNWLLPYDAVIQALKLNVKTLPDGQLEVRSPGIVTRIDLEKLVNDPELGLVFSIADLQRLFGVSANFDIELYTIILDVPWQNRTNNRIGQPEIPIVLDGLPLLQPATLNIAAIEQRIDANSTANGSTNLRGNFQAVGTAFDGSWFARANQPELGNQSSWTISEAQYLRQTDKLDFFLGSQPSFWQRLGTGGEYWGLTFIQRQGFNPPQVVSSGAANPLQRLQADQIGRTVTGRAEPGTLVQLVQGFGNNVIAEVLVDSSGIYRFENITTQTGGYSNYRVFLYPEGRLTEQPEIREATFTTVPGQIPSGASAWVASAGLQRDFSRNESFFGDFSEFRGGIAGRLGLSENLTVGFGGVYDESLRGLTEIFYRPSNFPLRVAVSALAGDEVDVISDIRYEPSPNFNASFTSDRFSNRFNANWQVFSGLSLFANASGSTASEAGLQLNFSRRNFYTFARTSLDTENQLEWSLLQRLGRLGLNLRGNEIGTSSELTYNFSNSSSSNIGNSLILNYATRSINSDDDLLTLSWRYRSAQRDYNGNYLWDAKLGYGIGSQGNGIVATLGTTVLPGIMLQGRYQGVSLTRDDASFSVDLVSGLNLQQGINPGDRRTRYFRTQGGLMIQPFLDRNNNGKRDSNEEIYTENSDLLLMVNHKSIRTWRPQVENDTITVRLEPGTYRLDLDPAGFPLDWQAIDDAYAVDVVAGSYTTVMIPLIQAYTRTGVVTDAQGHAVAGARVEATQADTGKREFSVTNGAGVYYLEGLEQGNYTLKINGKLAQPETLNLEESSESFQELNLQQP
jgi:hypothetical protein